MRQPGIEGERGGELLHPVTQQAGALVAEPLGHQGLRDDVGDLAELRRAEAPGGQGRGADPQPGGDHRRTGVEGHRVAVDGDADAVQPVLGLLPVERGGAQVDQDQMHLGAAGQHRDPGLGHIVGQQPSGEDAGTVQGAPLALRELLARRHLEGHRLGRDDMLQRAALLPREDRGVDLLGQVGPAEDHPAARAAEGLVRGGRHDIGVRHRARVEARGHQPGEVRHVHHQIRAHLVGDPPERGEVQPAGVGRPTRDDHLGPVGEREPLDLVHVDAQIGLAHVVRHDLVQPAGVVDAHAVGQMPAVREVEAEDRVAGPQQREHRGRVGLGARMRLHVRRLGAEQLLHPGDGQPLDDIDVFTAAVVAAAGVALGVLVGQDRALGLHDGGRGEVLRGDHLEGRPLAVQFGADRGGDLRVQLAERDGERGGDLGGRVRCHVRTILGGELLDH
ncbi:hypothetical protein ADL28_43075 [Streptomyces violaceusniger]|uniref:Uncharacterized protein n=1 Tax=Streptomyces violaceusniger TaxID=68280 RepID=A0A0X3VFZ6_STRVO|nr:hypothetical protein ADL28_43075 [Streptomyces violaceusniger]